MKNLQKYETNPFINMKVVHTRGKKVSLGVRSHSVLNNETGQVESLALQAYKEVDSEEFVKIYTANVGLLFDLKSAGKKVLQLLLAALQKTSINKDTIYFDGDVALDIAEKSGIQISRATFFRGITELANASIVAKSKLNKLFFINPHVIFNGDRISFINSFKRKSNLECKKTEIEQKNSA